MPVISAIFHFIWELIKAEFNLFAAPFKNLEMLWVIIPIYLGWFFAEFYQEKRGTSLGNAISNATIALWVGIDWIRTTIRLEIEKKISFGLAFFGKIFLALLLLAYGIFIITEGIKAKRITHFIGRIRVVTYFILVFTPLFYGYVPKSGFLYTIIAMIVFFPIFYYFIEFIDRITPEPASIKEEGGKSSEGMNY